MAEPKQLGTLVVVVGQARNLPNKSRFGKQDPYCVIQVGQEKHRTASVKRGGQHPEWDKELRFTILEDLDDVLSAAGAQGSLKGKNDDLPALPSEPGVVTPATLASNARKAAAATPKKKKASKSMTVSVYADHPKEPELIGEAVVVIDDVLQRGEEDEWYHLSYKDKYSGEVYLELTFFSNAPPPVPPPVKPNARPGAHAGNSAPSRPGIPSSVSVTGMNLYIPPYQQGSTPPAAGVAAHARPSRLAASNSFAELGLPPRASSMVTPIPENAQLPPGHRPELKQSATTSDMLAGSMMSMSLGPGSRTNNPYQPPPSLGHNSPHRHSIAATSQPAAAAPWAPLLPHNGPVQGNGLATPLPRPVSSVDVPGQWNGLPSTPLQRPVSSTGVSAQSYNQQPQHHRTGSANLGIPTPFSSGIPASASYGNLPRPPSAQPFDPHRASSPQPPPRQLSPQPPQHYQTSAAQLPLPPSQVHPQRVASPQPMPQPMPSYRQEAPYTPPPQNAYSQQYGQQPQAPYSPPAHQAYQQSIPPLPQTPQQPGSGYNSYNSPATGGHHRNNSLGQAQYSSPAQAQYSSPAQAQYSSPSQGQPRPAPPPPVPQPPTASTGPYVPWYMQTPPPAAPSPVQQHSAPPVPPGPPGGYQPQHPQQNQYPGQQSQAARPAALPPRPQHGVGYYPSDELQVAPSSHSAPLPGASPGSSPAPPSHYNQPPQAQQGNGSYSGWNSSVQQSSQPEQSSTLMYAQQDAPGSWGNPARAPSPLSRLPDPQPPGSGMNKTNTDWRSYLAGIGSAGGQGQGQGGLGAPPPVPPRVASPSGYGAQADWYVPPPNVPQSISNGQNGQGQGQWQQGQGQGHGQGQGQWSGQQQW